MKNFIKSVLLFSICLFLLNLFFGLLAHKYYYSPYIKHTNNFSSEVYLISDSHGATLGSYTEKIGVTNFAYASDSYFDMKTKINSLIKKNSNLKKIIITVENHILSEYRDNRNNHDRSVLFSNYSESIDKYDFFVNRYLKKYVIYPSSKAHGVVSQTILSKVKRLFFNPTGSESYTEWKDKSLTERIDKSSVRIKEQYHSLTKSKTQMSSLIDIIQLCKNNNIELIGIKFPVSKEFNELLTDNNFGADSLFFSRGLKVLDYQNLFIRDSKYFFDQDHLNDSGRDKFIQILNSHGI
jgi:hypothetical protein